VEALVFGAGAVGLGLASALHRAGARVRVVARPATVRALAREGLLRTGLFGRHHAPPGALEAACALEDLPPRPADFVLVATKSFDAEEAARALAARPDVVGAGTRIVLCQNGLGSAEAFALRFGGTRVFHARVITGFRRPAPGHVEVTVHAAPILVGSLFGADAAAVAPLCGALSRGGLPCEPTADVAKDVWAKLLYNALLNPLGAIFDVPYGALGASAGARAVMTDLAREVFAVMRAVGQRTHWETPEAYLQTFYAELLPPTARHESSTLQDLRAGRRTEVDALLGEVVRLGEAHGVATRAGRALLETVRFLERRNRSMLAPDIAQEAQRDARLRSGEG
jgi:2-dehydropantoate 2-reductase